MDSNGRAERFVYPLLFLFLGVAGVVVPYLTQRGIPGDLGDTRLNSFLLEHAFLALSGRVSGFLSAPFFYPWPNTIGFSDTHWGSLPFYAAFRWAGFFPQAAFSGWFCVGTVLNFFSAFFVSRRLGLAPLGAGVGAFLFAFSLPVIAQDGHLQLSYRFYIPLAFLSFHLFLEKKQLTLLGLTALFVSLQFLSTFYMGYFLSGFLLVYGGVVFLCDAQIGENVLGRFKRTFLPRKITVWGLVLILVSSGVLLLVAIPYISTQLMHGIIQPYWKIRMMLPRLQSFFLADRSLLWFSNWEGFSSIPARGEHQLFLGVGTTFFLLWALLSKIFFQQHPFEKRLMLTLGVLAAGTLVVGGVSLYQILYPIPGVSAVRAVTRGVLVCLFPIGFIVGRVAEVMRDRPMGPFSSNRILGILLLLVVSDSILAEKGSTSSRDWDKRLAQVETQMGVWNKNSVLVLAVDKFMSLENIDAMMTAQKLGINTMNGYSGHFPKGWKPPATCSDVLEVLKASETFYRQKFDRPAPLQPNRLICVGFPEPDPGCRASLLGRAAHE